MTSSPARNNIGRRIDVGETETESRPVLPEPKPVLRFL
jgi:hypothetical protein